MSASPTERWAARSYRDIRDYSLLRDRRGLAERADRRRRAPEPLPWSGLLRATASKVARAERVLRRQNDYLNWVLAPAR